MFLFLILQYSESQTTRTQQQQMSATNTQTNFDGIHVSKGFVRGLQGQVLKLEQTQQSLIRQLEHANKLASEYHANAVSWQHKHDAAMHKMSETRHALEAENAQWNSASNQIMGMYERERKHRLALEHEMCEMRDAFEREILLHADRERELIRFQQHLEGHLEKALSSNLVSSSPSPSRSPSPDHPHRDDIGECPRHPREPMSPVSIPSPSSSPREVTIAKSTQPRDQSRDHPRDQDEYERDPVAYWRNEYPKWQSIYGEEEKTKKNQEGGDSDIESDESDDIDWEQRERDDWTESIRSRARRGRVAA